MSFNFAGFFQHLSSAASQVLASISTIDVTVHQIAATHPIVQQIAAGVAAEAEANGIPVGSVSAIAEAALSIAQALAHANTAALANTTNALATANSAPVAAAVQVSSPTSAAPSA